MKMNVDVQRWVAIDSSGNVTTYPIKKDFSMSVSKRTNTFRVQKTFVGSAHNLSKKLAGPKDSYSFAYKHDWLWQLEKILSPYLPRPVFGARILELGAGVHHPLGSAISSILMGAREAIAVEPGIIDSDYIGHALDHVLIGILKNGNLDVGLKLAKQLFSIVEGVAEPSTLAELGINFFNCTLLDIQDAREVDIFHSVAVLEHIHDFDTEVSRLFLTTRRGGYHVHEVDFINHDYYLKSEPTEIDKYSFLFERYEATNDTSSFDFQTCDRSSKTQVSNLWERQQSGVEILYQNTASFCFLSSQKRRRMTCQ